jgi:hypothetical protein
MSPCSSGLATLQRDPCRASHACGATCQSEHVAPEPREAPRPNPGMSLDELVKGDMPARVRRLTNVRSATFIDDNVALPAHRERHVERSVSPDAIVWSDKSDRPFVGPLPYGATFSTAAVASLDRRARHGHACMSLPPRW